MFGKLKLNLEDIQVESFETTVEARSADGTVVGASGILSGAPDCYASCMYGSCDSCERCTEPGFITECDPVATCTCMLGCGSGGGISGDPDDPTCSTTNADGTCIACC